ncbi:MAG: prepilin-type N-terminal cleavage/methylation domain-containing protein [Planctomycetota bacterium]|jgi:prepilin-type N-terminal cleavage/methylation domain-containing protein
MRQTSPLRFASSRGFTLVEILVVCGLLAIVMGLGAAFLGSVNRVVAVQAERGRVDALLRQAHNSAALEFAKAWVTLDPDSNRVTVKSMNVVGQWHFEDNDLTGYHPDDQTPALGNARLSNPDLGETGKIGRCLCFDKRGNGANFGTHHLFDSLNGIALEAWIFPERDSSSTIFRKGKGLKLVLAGNYLEGMIRGVGTVDNAWTGRSKGEKKRLTVPVPVGRWSKIFLSFDGLKLELRVNGALAGQFPPPPKRSKRRSRKSAPQEGKYTYKADEGADLIVGQGFIGRIDELRILAVVYAKVETLDGNVQIDPKRTTNLSIHFAPGGWLDKNYHQGPVTVTLMTKNDPGKFEVINIGGMGNIR